MSLNQYMHPRNLYKKRKPNFKELALKYPDFKMHLEHNLAGKLVLDFKNPAALRLLSTILLKEDFGLEVDIPADRLVPTIPLRLNYIHWIEDLIASRQSSLPVRGIDIGTGSCCIYPLLGHKLNGWNFLATELDEANFTKATENVHKNNFQDSITVKKVGQPDGLRSVVEGTGHRYDFCMCNPPFYSHEEEDPTEDSAPEAAAAAPWADRPPPNGTSTASRVESVTWGGEYQFVNRMIQDSLVLRDTVRIYTSMVGKKQNMLALKYELKNLKVPVVSSTEFCQGRTMRWGLGWSYDTSVSFTKSQFKSAKKKKEKRPLALCVPTELSHDFHSFCLHIKQLLQDIKVNYVETKSNNWVLILTLFATENTWSHQRRQRRQRLREEKGMGAVAKGDGEAPPPTCSTPPPTTDHTPTVTPPLTDHAPTITPTTDHTPNITPPTDHTPTITPTTDHTPNITPPTDQAPPSLAGGSLCHQEEGGGTVAGGGGGDSRKRKKCSSSGDEEEEAEKKSRREGPEVPVILQGKTSTVVATDDDDVSALLQQQQQGCSRNTDCDVSAAKLHQGGAHPNAQNTGAPTDVQNMHNTSATTDVVHNTSASTDVHNTSASTDVHNTSASTDVHNTSAPTDVNQNSATTDIMQNTSAPTDVVLNTNAPTDMQGCDVGARKEYLFQCCMLVKRKMSYMQLELALGDGGGDREMLHQLLQYFRNKLLP
ncbi:RNA N6-adenosine-methyltransferase mettl16-like [Argonauta hians]